MNKIAALVVGACLTILLVGCGGKDVVTASELNSIPPGATYEAVVSIIGAPGERSTGASELAGVIVPAEGEAVYLWKNKDGSVASCAFRRGRLVSKASWAL